ncbi:MAG TPA: hypothetical protein VF538_16045 [Pyrinomonadaceae bacterium]
MYKPNFCAECGERVLRERWRAWTSRRFCPACEKRFRRGWLAPAAACCALVCAGFAFGRLMRPAPPPLTIERGALPLPSLLVRGGGPSSEGAPEGAQGRGAPVEATRSDLGAGALEAPTDPAEIVSVCGARTKKGTPCQRRVRGTGRCWQHRGMRAMLPPEKLIVHD